MNKLIIGTRGSTLALSQTEEVRKSLKALFPDVQFEVQEVRTEGDKKKILLSRHAAQIGFFTKELEEALVAKKIDIAVHSLKDLPTKNPEALEIAAVPKRETPQDGLVTGDGRALSSLASGSRIGTGSARRKAQLLRYNPSLDVVGIRGNLDTRLRKLKENGFDALVLALAGLHRLGIDLKNVFPIPFEVMLPAPGQGALAVQIRRGDRLAKEVTAKLDDPVTRRLVTAERAFLSRLGGGCQLPLGALALDKKGEIVLEGVLLSENGKKEIRAHLQSGEDAAKVGERLGEKFFELGAEELLNDKG